MNAEYLAGSGDNDGEKEDRKSSIRSKGVMRAVDKIANKKESFTVKELLSEVDFVAASKSFGKVKPASEILKKAEKAEKRYGTQKEDPKKDDKDELDESIGYEVYASRANNASKIANEEDAEHNHMLAMREHLKAAKKSHTHEQMKKHVDAALSHLNKAADVE